MVEIRGVAVLSIGWCMDMVEIVLKLFFDTRSGLSDCDFFNGFLLRIRVLPSGFQIGHSFPFLGFLLPKKRRHPFISALRDKTLPHVHQLLPKLILFFPLHFRLFFPLHFPLPPQTALTHLPPPPHRRPRDECRLRSLFFHLLKAPRQNMAMLQRQITQI